MVNFFLIIILTACGHSLPKFDNIDLSVWKEDKNACIGNRTKTLVHLDQQKDKLKSLSEMEIIKLLGKPDRNELYKRNQKFYYYFLEPGLDVWRRQLQSQAFVHTIQCHGIGKRGTYRVIAFLLLIICFFLLYSV